MKQAMMVVAALSMLASPAFASAGTQVQTQTQAKNQVQAQAKAGTCDGTQKRLHAQAGMKQQLQGQAKGELRGGGHMYRGGRGGR